MVFVLPKVMLFMLTEVLINLHNLTGLGIVFYQFFSQFLLVQVCLVTMAHSLQLFHSSLFI